MTEELGLRGCGVELAGPAAEPGLPRGPAVLAVRPAAARPPPHELSLRGEQREDARPGADLRRPARSGPAERELRREERVVPGEIRRERLAARLDAAERRRAEVVEPRGRVLRDAARLDEALQPPALARRHRPGAGRVDDLDELPWDDPERPPHGEHPDERPPVVELGLEVGDLEAGRPRPDREEDRRRVAGVQDDDGAGRRERVARACLGGQPVAERQPGAPFLDVDPSHPAVLPLRDVRRDGGIGSRPWRSRST